jgi:hypothetical protein
MEVAMPSRRSIVLTGSSIALLGIAGGALALTREPAQARAPWRAIDAASGDVRLDALRHAVLAPNPHNRQPWLVELIGNDRAVLRCDLDRRLPHTDPYDRQIVIGFGCFLELARIAAAERGVRLEIEPFPEGEPAPRLDHRPIAALRFQRAEGLAPDPLFARIASRRSAKVAFDTGRRIETETLTRLVADTSPDCLAQASAEPVRVERLRALTWDAWEIEARTPRTWMESVDLIRIGRGEIDKTPDGIALGGPMMEAMRLLGLVSRATLADPDSSAGRAGAARYRRLMASAMGYVWHVTPGNRRHDQLAAGRAYVRSNLRATALGLGLQPVSQALQEYPEMAETQAALRAELGIAPGTSLQMLARLGYGPAVPAAPRWQLETRLTRA